MTTTNPDLAAWIGRSEERQDHFDARHLALMHATMDAEAPAPGAGDPLPPGWHWIFFSDASANRLLGRDGHMQRGEFLPPVDLPRRMWAGGRLEFIDSLPVGSHATRRSTILSVSEKEGRTGPLVFVTVGHEIIIGDKTCLREEHDIVYREDPAPGRGCARAARRRAGSRLRAQHRARSGLAVPLFRRHF